jgi:hypothetical protein
MDYLIVYPPKESELLVILMCGNEIILLEAMKLTFIFVIKQKATHGYMRRIYKSLLMKLLGVRIDRTNGI